MLAASRDGSGECRKRRGGRMLELSTLGEYLKKNPEIMRKRTLLQSTLRDIFPQDKRMVNLLLIGFEEGIFSLVGTAPTCERLAKLVRTITDNHGVGEENAVYIIETWFEVVFHEPLPKGFGSHANSQSEPLGNPAQDSEQRSFLEMMSQLFGSGFSSSAASASPYQATSSLSVDDVREVFFRTKGKLMRKCGIRRSQDMSTWDVVDMHNESHYSRSPYQREKSLIVRKLGKGRYQEPDFAYIRTSTDMTRSWGVTYDRIIVPEDTDAVIPFDEIDYVESERGLFTDTMTIFLKNGKRRSLNEYEMLSTPVHDNISDLADFLNVIKDM